MSNFKTLQDIKTELDFYDISVSDLTKGVMQRGSFYNWVNRGLPDCIIKYHEILQRLEMLKAQKKAIDAAQSKGWAPLKK